jgi:hypothetical protein
MELVDELTSIHDISDEFNFSILVEMNPIKKTYTYICKIIGIIMKAGTKTFQMNYNNVREHMLNYIEVKENLKRKIGIRKQPFWIDGCSKVQTFKNNNFIEYCFRNPDSRDIKMIARIREKFNIDEPREFKGEKLHFDENIFEI